jgi:DNA end-binding protein Ku
MMPRPIWKGHISFGLVSVPVMLHSLEQRGDLSFHLIDSRDAARVRYQRVNDETGEEVPWDSIVKGYEYDDGRYVLLSDEELQHASVEMTHTIEIEQFVDFSKIDVQYFERPYVLVPAREGEKGYALLRAAIAESGKAGIATVVIRTRQYLAALVANGDALMLELLRYKQELRDVKEFELPSRDLRKINVAKKEIDLAKQLIEGMSTPWKPADYHDEYRDVLMKLIDKKIKSGKSEVIDEVDDTASADEPGTINFMEVLKKSLAGQTTRRGPKRPTRRKRSGSTPRRKAKRRAS